MSKPKIDSPVEVPPDLIKELLTESELRMVKQRLVIVKLLKEQLSIRAIAQKVGVGTDTVVRVSKKLQNSKILKNAFSDNEDPPGLSKWVFGQISSKEDLH